MRELNLLLDTNTLIYLSKRKIHLDQLIQDAASVSVSIISYMEALGYSFKEQNEKSLIEKLISNMETIYISKEIADRVILIRQERKIKLPDAIIAATAIIGNYTLCTNNSDDFKNIAGLELRIPSVY